MNLNILILILNHAQYSNYMRYMFFVFLVTYSRLHFAYDPELLRLLQPFHEQHAYDTRNNNNLILPAINRSKSKMVFIFQEVRFGIVCHLQSLVEVLLCSLKSCCRSICWTRENEFGCHVLVLHVCSGAACVFGARLLLPTKSC